VDERLPLGGVPLQKTRDLRRNLGLRASDSLCHIQHVTRIVREPGSEASEFIKGDDSVRGDFAIGALYVGGEANVSKNIGEIGPRLLHQTCSQQ